MKKSRFWLWLFVAFVLGGAVGASTHYIVTNWNGFFVKCPSGARPDKHGCCEGEVYTDADGLKACCPDGSDSCFPPLK